MHCTSVSLAQGGEGLGAMRGREKALRYLEEGGFEEVEIHHPDHDIQDSCHVARA